MVEQPMTGRVVSTDSFLDAATKLDKVCHANTLKIDELQQSVTLLIHGHHNLSLGGLDVVQRLRAQEQLMAEVTGLLARIAGDINQLKTAAGIPVNGQVAYQGGTMEARDVDH